MPKINQLLQRALAIILFAAGFCLPATTHACDLSQYTLDSIVFVPGSNSYNVYTQLCIGAGIQGVNKGADGPTGTFAFAFYGSNTFALNSYGPASVTSVATNCAMPAAIAGPQGPPFNSQQTLVYLDQNCPGSFTCISNTAQCGTPHSECFSFVFNVNQIPDSICALGIEGAGNPTAGCYSNPDMCIDFLVGPPSCSPDVTGPMFPCPPTTTLGLDSNCQYVVPNYQQIIPVTDNCDPNPTLTQSVNAGTTISGPGSSVTISLFATDASMNSSTNMCTFTNFLADLSPPTLTCPPAQTLPGNANCAAILPNYISMGSISDNCDANVAISSQSPTAGTTVTGTTTVSLFGADNSGNSATCTFAVAIPDQTPPSITCPPATTLALGFNCQASLPDFTGAAQATDNCGNPAVTQVPPAGTTLSNPGTQTVTLTATDGANNSSSCTLNVSTADSTAPVVICPPPVTLSLGSNCQVSTPNFAASAQATDNCSVPVVTQLPVPGTNNTSPGTQTVTLTAVDSVGNVATCSFPLTIVDNTTPTVTCPPAATLVLGANCQVSLPNFAATAQAVDNCGSPTITQAPAAGTTISSPGLQTVTLTATDSANNSSSCTLSVTVADQTPPTLTCPPAATLNLNTNCQVSLPDYTGAAQAQDNCGTLTVTQAPLPGSAFNAPGAQTVTLTATDGDNNATTCTLTVTAVDVVPPQVTCPPNQVISPNVFNCTPSVSWTAPTATDNCSVSQSSTHNPGDNFPVGTTTVTYTATDGSGNTTQCSFDITVNQPVLPNLISIDNPAPCVGDTANVSTAPGWVAYNWSTGGTSNAIQVTTSGWYWVDITNMNNCVARDSILVNFSPAPMPTIVQSGNTLCTGTFASYQWYLNGNPISGANGFCYLPTANGNYTVMVTDSNGCSNTSAPFMLVALADLAADAGFDLYPNPAAQTVHLRVRQAILNAGSILIYDLAGKVVMEHRFQELTDTTLLDLSQLAGGSYIVEIASDGLHGRRRLVHLE